MKQKNNKNTADEKIDAYVTKLKEQLKAVTASTSTAQAFLISTGVFDSGGEIRHDSKE